MDLIKCPACGKENDATAECTRCGCDLDILARIRQAAEQELFRGQESLTEGDSTAAMRHAVKSWHLKKSPEASQLAFLSSLAAGDFEQAGRWYALNI